MDRDDPTPDVTPELLERRLEAQRPVDEAGGGESEGFELAERELIERASHSAEGGTSAIETDSRVEAEDPGDVHGEPDGVPHDR